MSPCKVLYFGTYDKTYSRNRIMIAGLRAAGVEVIECHIPLWHGTADKVAAARGELAAVIGRAIKAYFDLLRVYWPLRHSYDVMMLGYAGHFDVFLARFLSWLARCPLVFDVFMSLYLIASERQLPARHILRWLEYLAYQLPDLLIIDTAEYEAWLRQAYGLARARIELVPTGADNQVFKPLPPRSPDGMLRVIYYGTFIRNHGIDYIIEAARLLVDCPAVRFELVGTGPERGPAEALVRRYGLTNVTFIDWLEQAELIDHVAQADVCLGAFGQTPQSLMTIQNKIYEGLAMGRPVVTGDSPTVRAVLLHGEHVYLVDRAHPQALADALLILYNDPALRLRLAENGQRLFSERFTIETLGRRTWEHVQSIKDNFHPGRLGTR